MWLDCFPVSLDALNQMLCRLVGERHAPLFGANNARAGPAVAALAEAYNPQHGPENEALGGQIRAVMKGVGSVPEGLSEKQKKKVERVLRDCAREAAKGA
jgi:hypothetical protein